jgi:hypothetical protein
MAYPISAKAGDPYPNPVFNIHEKPVIVSYRAADIIHIPPKLNWHPPASSATIS